MKQTSIDKLSEVYNYIKGNSWKLTTADQAAAFIQDVIRAEATTKVKGSKFDIYNYVSKDKYGPQMCGVYHNEGWRVASDAHILFAEECEYPAEYEGKSLLKDGSFAEGGGKYPKWRSVVPSGDGYKPYEFDTQKFYDWVEQKRAAHKTETGKGIKFGELWSVRIGPCLFMASMFDKLVAAMNYLGATQLFVRDARSSVYAATDKGLVLLMPRLSDVQDENIVTLA